MLETEVQKTKGSARDIPEDILQNFLEMRQELLERSVLPWAEHCTECAVPHCYSTCDFYTPREDLKCRRFVDGMVPIDLPRRVEFVGAIGKISWVKIFDA